MEIKAHTVLKSSHLPYSCMAPYWELVVDGTDQEEFSVQFPMQTAVRSSIDASGNGDG
jgi:hypothetical protein